MHPPVHAAGGLVGKPDCHGPRFSRANPVKKRTPTGKQRGRPKATEVVAKTNRKMDEFYRKKPVQSDAAMPLAQVEEEKEREEPSEA